ncbi:MAG TPA: HEAT repeat domain-containing protein [Pyrinomonadaceae bacterium]
MNKVLFLGNKFINFSLLVFFFAVEVWTQVPSVYVPQQADAPEPVEDDTWWYVTLLVLFVGLAGAIYWWHTSKKASKFSYGNSSNNRPNQSRNKTNSDAQNLADSSDVDKQIEWLRKNRAIRGKNNKNPKREGAAESDKPSNRTSAASQNAGAGNLSGRRAGERIPETKYEDLPIYSFTEIKPTKEYTKLPISNDSALMDAIEISQDEFEEDEKVREIALRVLESFKTRNSAECLGQMALYDLSSNLRSKAVASLADFDHESVFEDILLACADPTREVRASAARGLFRLSFDRADAWTRIAESRDEFRMRQAAQAAAEAGLIERTFDRLVHTDKKIAYEAVTFTALLIKAGEFEKIFEAIDKHRDRKVKLALLHVLKIVKDEATLPNLYALLEQSWVPSEIKEKADEIIRSFDLVPA